MRHAVGESATAVAKGLMRLSTHFVPVPSLTATTNKLAEDIQRSAITLWYAPVYETTVGLEAGPAPFELWYGEDPATQVAWFAAATGMTAGAAADLLAAATDAEARHGSSGDVRLAEFRLSSGEGEAVAVMPIYGAQATEAAVGGFLDRLGCPHLKEDVWRDVRAALGEQGLRQDASGVAVRHQADPAFVASSLLLHRFSRALPVPFAAEDAPAGPRSRALGAWAGARRTTAVRCREGDRPPSCGVAARSCGGVLVTGPPQSSLDVLGKLVGVEGPAVEYGDVSQTLAVGREYRHVLLQVTHPLVAANQLLHTWHTLDRDLAHLRAWHVNHVLMGASSAGDGPLTLQDVHVARHKWADLTLNDPVKALAVWVMAVEAGLSHAQCWWRLEDVAAHPGLAGRVCEAVAASRELPATDLGCYAREDAWGGQVEAGLSNAGLPPPSLGGLSWGALEATSRPMEQEIVRGARQWCTLLGYAGC